MDDYSHGPVTPFTISPSCSASELVARMAGTSFQARNLAEGADIWAQMLSHKVTIFFGLAGAMVPAGMRQVMVYLIENRLIDCLVTTGANMFHDLHETLGRKHWKGEAVVDDRKLCALKLNRIYDVLAPEDDIVASETFITDFARSLKDNKAYTTREFFFLLGKKLSTVGKEKGILTAAAKASIPIYCPALGDSVFGPSVAAARVEGGKTIIFDIVKDVIETVKIAVAARATGAIYIGGGTPKNFIQQAQVYGELAGRELKGHQYAIQITADSPQWGGLSGCTFDEARSWRKVAAQARAVTIYSDATIALPILVSALAESKAETIRNRKRATFLLDEELQIK